MNKEREKERNKFHNNSNREPVIVYLSFQIDFHPIVVIIVTLIMISL